MQKLFTRAQQHLPSLKQLTSSSLQVTHHQVATIPPIILYDESFISDSSELNRIWGELQQLRSSHTFINNPHLKRSIFNLRGKQLESVGREVFPTLHSYLMKLQPLFTNRAMTQNMSPNTVQFNHYDHIVHSGCPMHVDARGLGYSIGMLSFGNEATMSFLRDPPAHFTQEQVEACEDELRLKLPNGSLLVIAEDARYEYLHGIRHHIQHQTLQEHPERYSVVFWYQE